MITKDMPEWISALLLLELPESLKDLDYLYRQQRKHVFTQLLTAVLNKKIAD